MRQHITFRGLSTSPTDHEAHEGDCATLTHLIAEDEALRPIGITTETFCAVNSGATVIGIHRTADYIHLIIEESDGTGGWHYAWTTGPINTIDAINSIDSINTEEGTHPLTTLAEKAHAASVGHTLCLITDTAITYCIWQHQKNGYAVVSRDDLLYDIHLTQDDNATRTVSLPISTSLATWLDHPDQLQVSQHTALSHIFPHFYDSEEAYATAATMVAAQMEEACDRTATAMGAGTFRHVCFGVAALRLTDGSHLLFSNLFALLPAHLSPTINADREEGLFTMQANFHRHVITVTMRHPERAALLVRGIDIFLTRTTQMLDMRKAVSHTTDNEGHTTSLTFGELSQQPLLQHLDQLAFYPAMTIGIGQSGQPTLVLNADYGGTPADLSDMRRWVVGARVAHCHNGRLLLGDTTAVVHNPLEIGIRYRFGDGLTAGDRPDTGDAPEGRNADLVVHALADGAPERDMWWRNTVAYPMAGMMMAPGTHLRSLEYHLRLSENGTYRYFSTSQPLHPLTGKGMSVAVFGATGQIHRTPRPLALSLLVQQVRALVANPVSGGYAESMLLWQEETAADFNAHAAQAKSSWPLNKQGNRMLSSAQGNPLVFPATASVTVGDSPILNITTSTRRSADGLFGDGQYYVLNHGGVWLLRLSGGRWSAQQKVTHAGMLPNTQAVCTNDAVIYLSAQGVMALKGSKTTCLSDSLREPPFRFATLPYAAEIIATEPALPLSAGSAPHWMGSKLREARMAYDSANDRLWLFWPTKDQPAATRWPGALVCSLRSGAWGTAMARLSSVVCDGGEVWATVCENESTMVARVRLSPSGRIPVLLCTRPLSLGTRYEHKSVERLILRGLFNHRGAAGSHLGIALYGSNDLFHWHLISSSADQYLCCHRGTPYRWFRIAAIGQLLPGESIEGVTVHSAEFIVQSAECIVQSS